jgi:hypothetical protein
MQNARTLHKKSLSNEKSTSVLSGVLAGKTSARAPDGRIENYRSHTMLVFQENQGPW